MRHSPSLSAATAASPCIGHCTTVLGDEVCRSCLRTFDEVTRWPTISDEERIRINRRIALLHSTTPSSLPYQAESQGSSSAQPETRPFNN
ncbi:MAG: DUF1289 domain-containing protein [Gallionella sp.]|nr:DUF1289 domain-containing protein [Gallionella sp.]